MKNEKNLKNMENVRKYSKLFEKVLVQSSDFNRWTNILDAIIWNIQTKYSQNMHLVEIVINWSNVVSYNKNWLDGKNSSTLKCIEKKNSK